jgi:superfamily II DNA helicase RecQ
LGRFISQESGRAGRDSKRSEAIIMMPAGRQKALQQAHAHKRDIIQWHKGILLKKKKRIKRRKIDQFINKAVCHQMHLNQAINTKVSKKVD